MVSGTARTEADEAMGVGRGRRTVAPGSTRRGINSNLDGTGLNPAPIPTLPRREATRSTVDLGPRPEEGGAGPTRPLSVIRASTKTCQSTWSTRLKKPIRSRQIRTGMPEPLMISPIQKWNTGVGLPCTSASHVFFPPVYLFLARLRDRSIITMYRNDMHF